jgi:type II secretory pathway predicted ATPase ExeA
VNTPTVSTTWSQWLQIHATAKRWRWSSWPQRRHEQASYAAVDQRVTLRVDLEGMDLAETTAYVKHHLALAGRSDTLFSDDALVVIQQASRGLPRAVNNLALQALVATFAQDKSIVDESAAKMAVVEAVEP